MLQEQDKEATLLETISGVMRRLNVSRSTVYKWICEDQIKTVRFGRAIRVPCSEVERLASEGTGDSK